MKDMRPGILSVRSVNEYRRRDTIAYLGLRYYLGNSAARRDCWAREVATDLILARTDSPYLRVNHFKEATGQGDVKHRPISLPCANEALAEAALLKECANHPIAFANPKAVFSYELNAGDNRDGIFRHYVYGLRERHEQIAKACELCPTGTVRYADIKRFYPSIKTGLATRTWQGQCEVSQLPKRFRDTGQKLITDHAGAVQQENGDILTGPMFSHLLGNLVLRKIDDDLSANLPVKYFRYVDDITLVGERDAIGRSLGDLRVRLSDLGFELHDDSSQKSIEVSASDWLKGRDDFSGGREWQALIGDVKKFLLLRPEQGEALQSAFRDESVRIPVRDYSAVVHERSFLERVMHFSQNPWFRSKAQALGIKSLVLRAKLLRIHCEGEFQKLLAGAGDLTGYERKRRTPQLRWQAGRLIYLAEDATLGRLATSSSEFTELYLHSQVMKAVASGEIDELLSLGTNAAQAAAQPLLAAGKVCSIAKVAINEIEEQGLAIFRFNGVPVRQREDAQPLPSEILRFATSGSDMSLMRSPDPFIREIACLHGLSQGPRHEQTLRAVFDEDEELAMDAIDQFQQSTSP
jgi:hypothetical protein